MKTSDDSEHEMLFEEAFWKQFEIDIHLVQARLIIQSAFIANRRVLQVIELLEPLIKRNVQVCVYLQTPANWNIPVKSLTAEAAAKLTGAMEDIKALLKLGVHIVLRPNVHVKFAILDEAVFYEGSLNILSHNNTFEGMRRFNSVSQTRKKLRQERFLNCHSCAKLKRERNFSSVHEQLKSARQRLQMTQKEVADLTHLSQAKIARMESEQDMRLSSLAKLAESLGITIVLVPNSLTPALANLFNQFENHKLLNALQGQNIAPTALHPREDYIDFSPNTQLRVQESETSSALMHRSHVNPLDPTMYDMAIDEITLDTWSVPDGND
jgi:transcriptional regulator with XRE-family HTH domain